MQTILSINYAGTTTDKFLKPAVRQSSILSSWLMFQQINVPADL